MLLARFLIGGLSTVYKETHAYSLNGVHLIWQCLHDSQPPTKYTYHVRIWYYVIECVNTEQDLV